MLIFLFLVNAVQIDNDPHLVPYLMLSAILFLRNFLEGFINHCQNIENSNFFLFIFLHQETNLIFELLVVVEVGHPSSLQLLLYFSKTFLNMFVSLSLPSFALLLLVFVDVDEYSDGLPSQFVPSFSSWMRFYKHSNNVILREVIFFEFFLTPVLIFLLVLSLKFLCASTVIARKPSNIRVKIFQML